MTSNAQKILDAALALPDSERERVTEILLASVRRESPEDIRRAWVEAAVERLSAYETNGGATQSLDEVEARLRAAIRSR